jgi:ATP-dependent RNA helicase RhlE
MSFQGLGLNESLLKSVEKAGYEIPTPIQVKAIPVLLEGKDVLGTAQTGTGKTAAFALPMIQKLMQLPRLEKRVVRALIIVPTRELAVQIQESFLEFSRFSNLRVGMFFGGVSKFGQINALKQGVDIAVATPGRLLDLMRDRYFHPQNITTVVLDEADQMLDMGFLPDVKTILQSIPKPRQISLFSATMPGPIATLAAQIMSDPVRIEITPVHQPLNKIAHQTIRIEKNQKLSLLMHILKNPALVSVLIFMRTKRGAKRTALNLVHQGYKVVELHGNQSQAQRQYAMKKFKDKQVRILVATDLASRGIDIDKLTHVINFDMPETAEAFLHRTGRTGRAGFSGDVINFVSREENSLLHMINRHTNLNLTPHPLADFVFDSKMVIHGNEDTSEDEGFQQRKRRYTPRGGEGSRSSEGGSRSYQGSRSSEGGSRSYQGSRSSEGGSRSYQGSRSTEGSSRPPYQGSRSSEGSPRPYQGSRSSEGGSRSYQGSRSSEGGSRTPYQGSRPYQKTRSYDSSSSNPSTPTSTNPETSSPDSGPAKPRTGYQGKSPRSQWQSKDRPRTGYRGSSEKSSSYAGGKSRFSKFKKPSQD